jgi:hypothetical protein
VEALAYRGLEVKVKDMASKEDIANSFVYLPHQGLS